ncbi:uncharacterized protein zgc:66448 [Engraulis encrasicolus]|uniref:uncharacterized protein zgc:66448 n=1 Tax=Engraulis encrasicolus TaxID=184585 RepID=UPI002FD44F13
MAAEYTQKPETVSNDSQITSEKCLDDEKNDKTVKPTTVLVFPIKKEEGDAKQAVKTDVDSGLISHADSSKSPVHSGSTASQTKTEEPSVSSKLQMEWSDTEEDLEQCLSRICENSANGAVTPELKQEHIPTEARTTLKQEEEPKLQDGETVLTKPESKELTEVQPAASEETQPAASEEKEDDREKEECKEEATGDAEQEEEQEAIKKKQRKTRLECRDCGKCFTRRETYNLHRHFHSHQDEQASLTCKECGLTFQHRSSLIKHRNEHKAESEKASASPAKRSRRSGSIEAEKGSSESEKVHRCEHCGKKFETLARLRTHNCKRTPEKPYRCPLCRKEFQYRVSITAHMQTHSLECRFRCLECNKGFQSPTALRIHQRSHAALKPYSCPECGMVFRHRSVMEDHRRRHTEERPYHCMICGKYFRLASLLHQHQYLHTGKKPFRCRECGKAFAFSQNLRVHNRQHQKHPHCCPHCLDTFPDEATLQQHIARHEKENAHYGQEQRLLYNCPLCSQVYYRPADLRVHMLVHESEFEGMSNGLKELRPTFPCSRCHLTFLDEASLKAHAVTHEPPTFVKKDVHVGLGVGRKESMPGSGIYGDQIDKKPLKCPDCGRGFRHRSVLELHMRIHTKDKPYRCNVCGKSFKYSSYLQQHVIIHTGKKPYKCPDCGKDFAFFQNMKTHHRLHQQKPFRCTQCRKGYSDEAQLKTHMLTHSGDKPHKCTICDKSFGLVYLLRDHMNTHTGERPHRCTDCGKAFQWLSSLLVHQKIHSRKSVPYSHAYSSDGLRRESGAGVPPTTESLRPDWPRWDGAQRTPPNTYAAAGSQGPEWQDRASQQQPQSFGRQPELSVQPPGTAVNQPSPWKLDQQREQQRPKETAPAKPVLQQPVQQQQQWPAERQTQAVQNVGWISMMPPQQTTQQAQQQQQQQQHAQSEAGSHLLQPQSASRTDPSFSVMFTRPQPPPEEDTLSWTTKASPVPVPHSQSPLKVAGAEHNSQNSPPSVFWGSTGASVPHTASRNAGSSNLSTNDQQPMGVTSAQTTQPGLSSLPPMEEPKLWSTVDKQPQQQQQQSPGLANQPLPLNASPLMDPSRIPPGKDGTLWTFQTTSTIPKALGSQDLSSSAVDQLPQQLMHLQQQKLQLQQQQQQLHLQQQQQMQQQQQLQMQQQQLQQLQMQQQQQLQLQQQQMQLQQQQQQQQKQTWVTSPTSNPVALQYGPPRFSHGDSSPAVWGFQAAPAGSQTLMAGPMQQGAVQAQSQLPLMTGPQIIMNQASTFLSPTLRPLPPLGLPAPHPLQIPRPAPPPPPQNIFFSPQGIMGDRPTLSQTSPFSTLPPPRTELPSLTGRLPFSSDRRQCVVCGCTFAQEVELQMHYMQHAKGEI